MRSVLFIILVFIGIQGLAQQVLVPPYLQPGNAPSLSKEMKVILWQTDSVVATYSVEYAPGTTLEGTKVSLAKVTVDPLVFFGTTHLLYRAHLTGLSFDTEYTYRVRIGDRVIGASTFTSRTKGSKVRFAAFGDCGAGSPQEAAVSYQIYQLKPQFALASGDLAYNNGLAREFQARFFPYFTALEPSLEMGSPLMRSIPVYMFVGNHDVYGADLQKYPDGLAYFYYSDVPMNAPVTMLTTEVTGPADRIKAFKKATDGRFPKITNYSFDYGNVHITTMDANAYTNPLDPGLVEWLRRDLGSCKADWKIVAFHHPGFSSSKAHYDYQQARLLAPLLEELGVDMVINGHIHNYQRSKPLRFAPKMNAAKDQYLISPEGRVDGKFTLDEKFDGVSNTKANGIIYIVSGTGGAQLYDPALSNKPELWTHEPADNWVPYTVKLISDVHSFTWIETDGKTMVLKQIKYTGETLDEIRITK